MSVIGTLLLGVLGVLSVLWAYNPETRPIFPPCPFLRLTGLYCPGCGTLRALHHLLRGNFSEAVRYNVLTLVALGFMAIYGGSTSLRKQPKVSLVVLWVVVGYFVLRNIPVLPFLHLAPKGVPPRAFSRSS
jgi:hypothetical protein